MARFTIVAEQAPVANTPYPLGRNLYHDSRSRRFPFLAITAPKPVKHERRIDILDQGQTGSCCGNAGIGCLGTDPFYTILNGISYLGWNEAAALRLYSLATAIDPFSGQYPPEDTGSNGLAIAESLKDTGDISGYLHSFSVNDSLGGLAESPFIGGIDWYDSMFTPDSFGIVRIAPNTSPVGGHEIVFDELTVSGLVGFQNSWGPQWGANGRGYMEISTFTKLMNDGGDATFFVPNTVPMPPPIDPPLVLSAVDRLATDLLPWLEAKSARTYATHARQIVRKFILENAT